MVTAPVMVGGFRLVAFQGLWFLMADDRIVSTLLDMGGGKWRARLPSGGVGTFTVPAEVEDPARYVAEQITQ